MEAEENPGMFLHAHCLHSADNSKTEYFPWQQTLTDITWKISRKVILVAPKYSSDGIILLILEMLLNLLFIAFLICSVNMGAIKKKKLLVLPKVRAFLLSIKVNENLYPKSFARV